MLAIATRNGEVMGSVPGLAHLARVSVDACEAALDTFMQPDKHSRTQEDEGRRVEKIDGGWSLLTYEKHRLRASKEDSKNKNAERQRRFRERQAKAKRNATVTHGRDIAEAEAEADTEAVPERERENAHAREDEPLGEIPTQLETLKTHLGKVRRGWGVEFGADEREALVRNGYLSSILALSGNDWADLGEMLGSSEKMAQRRESLKIGMPNRRTFLTNMADWLSNLDRWQARHQKRNGNGKPPAAIEPEPEPTLEEREEMRAMLAGSLRG